METKRVGIREAKVQLSRLLQLVRKGQLVVLTHRGKPIGKIMPIEAEDLQLAERLRRLEERGVIGSAPRRTRGYPPPPIPLADNLAQKLLQEDRSGGK